jgi:RHS repeat-associated protein
MVDPTGTTTYAYDNLDRLTSTLYPDGKTVTATYDTAGNRVTLTNPGPTTTTAQYDQANRLTQLTQGSLTWMFGYDGAGNRTSLTHPNGTSVAYAYLNNNWLSSISDKTPGGTPFQTTNYGYDQNGNRTSQTDPSGQTTFGYDDLNRLTGAAYPGGYGTWGWTYDDVGNRLTQSGPGGTTTYTYDANNRLTQAVASTTVTYGYDDNGNLLTISTGQSFTWDVFNRLTQATGPGGTATYTYNGDGLKTRRVGPSSTTHYYHDGIRSIYETNAQGQLTLQLDRDIFGNLLSARDGAGNRRHVHVDGLGSVTALTTPSGTVAATMLYDAWGNQRAISGSGHGNYRFTGAEMDATTGLYHMGARFYDSVIGRWLSEDPVQDKPFEPASLNFYAYVANNPVLLTDPKGTTPEQPPTPISPEEVRERARQTLEKIANQLGITVEELLQWADRLAKIGGILMAVGAVLSAVALAAYGGAITGVVAAIVVNAFAIASFVGAAVSSVALGIQYLAGKISFAQLAFGLATAWTPGVGTKAVAGIIGKAPTIAQMTRASVWGLARGWNMGSWVLNWT